MNEEDKKFEAKIAGRMSNGTCPCQMNNFENPKTTLITVICKDCGKKFKTNRKSDYCSKCSKNHI